MNVLHWLIDLDVWTLYADFNIQNMLRDGDGSKLKLCWGLQIQTFVFWPIFHLFFFLGYQILIYKRMGLSCLNTGPLNLCCLHFSIWYALPTGFVWKVPRNPMDSKLQCWEYSPYLDKPKWKWLFFVGLLTGSLRDVGYELRWRHFGAKYQDMHTDYTGQAGDV